MLNKKTPQGMISKEIKAQIKRAFQIDSLWSMQTYAQNITKWVDDQFFLFVDDFNKKSWVYFLRIKGVTFTKFKVFKEKVKVKTRCKISN